MGPASALLEWSLAGLAVVCAVTVGALVWRSRTRQFMPSRASLAGAVTSGVTLVLVGQLAAAGAIGVGVNRSLGIYLDWRSVAAGLSSRDGLAGDLGVGEEKEAPVETAADRSHVRRDGWYPMTDQPPAGAGTYRVYPVTGSRTGIHENVVVWVPSGVTDAEFATLPVVMALSGAYGSPSGFLRRSEFARHAAALIESHRVPRFLAVAPMVNVDMPHDTECVDYPGGPQAFTWLAEDVRQWAHHRLRVSLARNRWSVEGVSLGGYCAAKLHTLRPDAFSAGASVLGYFEPEPDGTTLNLAALLRTDPELRRRASVAWAARHHTPARDLRLLALSSPDDPQSYPQYKRFRAAMAQARGITYVAAPGVSHTNQSMGVLQAQVLPFLLGR